MSQMLTKVSTANGRTVFAKLEIYGNKFIRNDLGGHLFKDGSVLPRHFNDRMAYTSGIRFNGKAGVIDVKM